MHIISSNFYSKKTLPGLEHSKVQFFGSTENNIDRNKTFSHKQIEQDKKFTPWQIGTISAIGSLLIFVIALLIKKTVSFKEASGENLKPKMQKNKNIIKKNTPTEPHTLGTFNEPQAQQVEHSAVLKRNRSVDKIKNRKIKVSGLTNQQWNEVNKDIETYCKKMTKYTEDQSIDLNSRQDVENLVDNFAQQFPKLPKDASFDDIILYMQKKSKAIQQLTDFEGHGDEIFKIEYPTESFKPEDILIFDRNLSKIVDEFKIKNRSLISEIQQKIESKTLTKDDAEKYFKALYEFDCSKFPSYCNKYNYIEKNLQSNGQKLFLGDIIQFGLEYPEFSGVCRHRAALGEQLFIFSFPETIRVSNTLTLNGKTNNCHSWLEGTFEDSYGHKTLWKLDPTFHTFEQIKT